MTARVVACRTLTVEQLPRYQQQALALAAAGRSNREIAAELGISLPAVSNYLCAARRALGARSQIHALAMVLESGLTVDAA